MRCFLLALLLQSGSSWTSQKNALFRRLTAPTAHGLLQDWQRSRAIETAESLDASRYHLQILFVDQDNELGRIGEGLLARIAEHNDAVNILFPTSTTLLTAGSPSDPDPSEGALQVCESLSLCRSRSGARGSAFDLSYLDSYDLIVSLNEDIRSLLMRSLETEEDQAFYGPKCRLFSEFLNPGFSSSGEPDEGVASLLEMLDEELLQRTSPFSSELLLGTGPGSSDSGGGGGGGGAGGGDGAMGSHGSDVFRRARPSTADARLTLSTDGSAAVPNRSGWPASEAAMILAAAGLTKFCLETIDESFAASFASLLGAYFCRREHLDMPWPDADALLRRSPISGYFSPEERKERFEAHRIDLAERLDLRGSG
jgi:hypothetical protein